MAYHLLLITSHFILLSTYLAGYRRRPSSTTPPPAPPSRHNNAHGLSGDARDPSGREVSLDWLLCTFYTTTFLLCTAYQLRTTYLLFRTCSLPLLAANCYVPPSYLLPATLLPERWYVPPIAFYPLAHPPSCIPTQPHPSHFLPLPVTSHPTAPHLISSHPIPFQLIALCPTTSSHPVPPHPIPPRPVPISPCPFPPGSLLPVTRFARLPRVARLLTARPLPCRWMQCLLVCLTWVCPPCTSPNS